MSEAITKDNKNLFFYRIKFLGLIGVFLSPFIAGWLALYVWEIKPSSINYGTLVQPVKKITWPSLQDLNGNRYDDGFGRRWVFILFIRDQCSQACQSNLFYLRQIRTLLGRNAGRLQNVLVSVPSIEDDMKMFLQDYPDLIAIENFSDDALLAQFAQDEKPDSIGHTPQFYLIDPDQNYMMHYPPEPDQHRVLEDMRKLMKLSKIG